MEKIAHSAIPMWKPETPLPDDHPNFWTCSYGLTTFGDLFTPRQLVALTTFSDLVSEARDRICQDAIAAFPGSTGVPPVPKNLKNKIHPKSDWHIRGYVPHFEAGEIPQFITFRLFDTLPKKVLEEMEEELKHLKDDTAREKERRLKNEAALDAGRGECFLRDPRVAELVCKAFQHFDGEKYRLHHWCVMPNHIHALITPIFGVSLSSIVHSWKSFTAKKANEILGRTGVFWAEEYYDRFIRDEGHWNATASYILDNPVKAGLCFATTDWKWSSASLGALGARASCPCNKTTSEKGTGETPVLPADRPLDQGGTGPRAYAEAVSVYLAFALNKISDRGSSLCGWDSSRDSLRNTFGRQALPMVWDFAEANFIGHSSGSYENAVDQGIRVIREYLSGNANGLSQQADAQNQNISNHKVISSDPPYYDNIAYADLSDYFYVWLRQSLKSVFPGLLATMAVPKTEELVATPYRHGNKEKAENFFLEGMTKAMANLATQAHPATPITIYYAFKQSETDSALATSSTGWVTFLDAVLKAGFALTGTWPMRTELGNRMIGSGTNALASSIVLVCRKRPFDALSISRREFLRELNAILPEALDEMTRGAGDDRSPVAPVDLSQAIIGPGMAVFSKYSAVLEAGGSPMTVRTALQLINRFLAEDDFDADTQFCLHWFEQFGWTEGPFGVADTLSRGKGTSVDGMKKAGVLQSGSGKVRLLKWAEYPTDWDPRTDTRTPIWEALHQLIRALKQGGESASGKLLAALGGKAEAARQLAYRLYTLCERLGQAEDARAYNDLITSWGGIESAAGPQTPTPVQTKLDF